MNIAIIFAAGKGERLNFEHDELPKQFIEIEGKPLLIHTLENFQKHEMIDKIYISTLIEQIGHVKNLVKKWNIDKVSDVIEGGSCAMESIYKTLKRAKKDCDGDSVVLIHDGVRPIITPDVINNNIKSVINDGNAITIIPCNETIVVSYDKKKANCVPIRKETFKAQAPQSFRLDEIIKAHESVKSYNNIVDNCTLFVKLGKEVNLVEGNFGNIKITTPEDVYILEGILKYFKLKKENNA